MRAHEDLNSGAVAVGWGEEISQKDSRGNSMHFGVRERMEARTPNCPNDKFMEKGKADLGGLGSGQLKCKDIEAK